MARSRGLRLRWFPRALVLVTLGTLAFLGGARLEARFAQVQLDHVPIDRLLTNLQQHLEKTKAAWGASGDPVKKAQLGQELAGEHFEIGRLHAMAYSRRTAEATVLRREGPGAGDENQHPWYGYTFANHEQFEVEPAKGPADEEAGRKHLEQAESHYRTALVIGPANDLRPALELGHAWVLDQLGKDEEARDRYLAIMEEAWKKESDKQSSLGSWSIAGEAARYLEPHLKDEADAPVRARVSEIKKAIAGKGELVTPLIVPTGNETRLEALLKSKVAVTFDLSGFGARKFTTWPGPDAAFLVYDPHRTGAVTSGKQLFGSVSFWVFWSDGYHALAGLDDDGDGQIAGKELDGLALWNDRNTNGTSEPGEVVPVAAAGIRSLDCRGLRGPGGVLMSPRGVTFVSGAVRPTYDWVVREE